jgi:hypothetical protein
MLSDNQAERSRSIAGLPAHYFIFSETNLRKILDSTVNWLFVNSWGKKSKRNNLAESKRMGKASRSVAEWRFSHARG